MTAHILFKSLDDQNIVTFSKKIIETIIRNKIANDKTIDEIGDEIGADKLFYQTLEDLIEVTSIHGEQSWDASCFNGEYVTGNVTQQYLDDLEAARNDSAKSEKRLSDETIGLHNDE